MNVLKPNKQGTVFTLLQRGVSQREIYRLTGVDRKTIRRYADLFLLAGAESPNSSGVATGEIAGLIQIPPPWPPTLPAPAATLPKYAKSACEPHREWIEEQVRLKRNAQAIYQDLVDEHGFEARYNSVKRFVRGLRRTDPEQFDRLEFAPGEEAQVDYGEGALTRDPKTGRYRRPRLFVMTLRYSRRSFRQVIWKSSQENWARLHEAAFRYFGGATRYVVLDNLKEGVIKPDLYEPEINRVYGAMLAHYGVVADPARVRDADRKGTVENAIQHTQATALKGRRFDSIEDQNRHLLHWEEKWAATRIHGSARRQVEAMFQEERPQLLALPPAPFRYFTEVTRTVWDDTTVRVGNSSYAAQPAAIGSSVLVRIYQHSIEIRDHRTQALIRTHAPAAMPGSVILPDAERPFNPSRQTAFLLAEAKAIGPNVGTLCQRWFEHEGRVGQRNMWGVLSLAKKYPARIVDEACAVAFAGNVRSSKNVRLIADRVFEAALARLEQPAQAELPLTQDHPLIRTGDEYAALFNLGARHSAEQPHPTEETTVCP